MTHPHTFPEPVWGKADIEGFLDRHFTQARKFGTEILEIRPGFLRARLAFDERFLRPGGTISGPTQMTLVDTVFFYLILAHLGDEALAVTTSLNINFLRKPAQSDLIAEARLLKLGRVLCVGDATLFSDGDERPVAHAQLTYSIPPKRSA